MTCSSSRPTTGRSWSFPSTTRPASSAWRTIGWSRRSRGRFARATWPSCAVFSRGPARTWPAPTSRWPRSPPMRRPTACSCSSSRGARRHDRRPRGRSVIDFAHPGYLWGALAVALPILVHLFNQRRPRPLAFGAIEFVLRSQRQKASRLRLRQILLLALRCLLIAAVAVALARPQLRPKGAQSAAALGPQATALVLDASLSMRYRTGSTTLFARARGEALAALDRLAPEEPATVGLCAGPGGFAGGQLGAPGFDRAAARRMLQSAQPTYLGSDLTACLAQAA